MPDSQSNKERTTSMEMAGSLAGVPLSYIALSQPFSFLRYMKAPLEHLEKVESRTMTDPSQVTARIGQIVGGYPLKENLLRAIKRSPMVLGKTMALMPLIHSMLFTLMAGKKIVTDPTKNPLTHMEERVNQLADDYEATRSLEGGVTGALVNAGKSWVYNPIGSLAWHLRGNGGQMGGETTT